MKSKRYEWRKQNDYDRHRESRVDENFDRDSCNEMHMPEWRRKSHRTRADKCFGCSRDDHTISFCPDVRYFICKEKSHTSIDCK